MRKYLSHLVALGALCVALMTGFATQVRDALIDVRFRAVPRPASGNIVIVAIDSQSLDELGVWPWPRSFHAKLIPRLEAADAGDIAFDVDFSSRSESAADQAFADALKAAGGSVILPGFQQSVWGKAQASHINFPLREFRDNAWVSAVNVRTEGDGLVRRYWPAENLGASFVASMPALLARRSDIGNDPFLIDFSIRPEAIPVVSYIDVLRGAPETLAKLAGKSVIVGSTAVELGDRFNVPVHGIFSGPVLQALAAESILQHRDLRQGSLATAGLAVLVVVILVAAMWRRCSAGLRALTLFAVAGAGELGAGVLQANVPVAFDTSLMQIAILTYLVALAIDEIGLRGLLRLVAESRFQRLAAIVGDGLVCTDRNFRITVWNPSAAAIFGYTAEEVIGRPLETLWEKNRHAAGSLLPPQLNRSALQRLGGRSMELCGLRKSGDAFDLEICFSGWEGPDGYQCGAVIRDISLRKREELRIRYLAEHDTVTGLMNRDRLYELARDRMLRDNGAPEALALVLIGVDNFDTVNDLLGHTRGDEVLRAISERLRSCLGEAIPLARLGGAEFAGLLAGGDAAAADSLCSQVSIALDKPPIEIAGHQHRMAVSIGVALYPQDCGSAEELFGCAHLALGRAKAAPTANRKVVFDRAIRAEMEAQVRLESELRRALERAEFELFYQPQISLADASLVGAEALIRWRHPEKGLVPPGDFIPTVNRSPLSDAVALWVLETACRQASAWEHAGHPIRMGVNLSPSLVRSGALLPNVVSILRGTRLSPPLLELEITEDILLTDTGHAVDMLEKLRELGVRVVFDDFGTGYASLSYLKRFPLDGLKIDRSFVKDLPKIAGDAAIVSSMVTLARSLNLSVIAEGVEDEATALLLAKMGCHEGQGYLFGRPMPASDLAGRYLAGPEHGAPSAHVLRRTPPPEADAKTTVPALAS